MERTLFIFISASRFSKDGILKENIEKCVELVSGVRLYIFNPECSSDFSISEEELALVWNVPTTLTIVRKVFEPPVVSANDVILDAISDDYLLNRQFSFYSILKGWFTRTDAKIIGCSNKLLQLRKSKREWNQLSRSKDYCIGRSLYVKKSFYTVLPTSISFIGFGERSDRTIDYLQDLENQRIKARSYFNAMKWPSQATSDLVVLIITDNQYDWGKIKEKIFSSCIPTVSIFTVEAYDFRIGLQDYLDGFIIVPRRDVCDMVKSILNEEVNVFSPLCNK